jgi:hypothetical protein
LIRATTSCRCASVAEGEKYPLYGRSLALLRTNILQATGQPITPVQAEQLRRDARQGGQPKEPA